MRRRVLSSSGLVGLALLLLLCACGGGGSGGSPDLVFTSPNPMEPEAGTWRTWVVPDVTALLPAPPPASGSAQTQAELAQLQVLAGARTPGLQAEIDLWNLGTCKRWNEFQRGLVAARNTNPPRASRGYALVAVAMYDAMVAAFDAKYFYRRARPSAHDATLVVYGAQSECPSYVSERAAMSAAAAEVLAYLFPLDGAAIDALLQSALDADVNAGVHFPSDVTAGRTLGEAVGQLVLAYAQTDGADDPDVGTHTPDGTPYAPAPGPGTAQWTPTPPAFAAALLPGWGGVKTWILLAGDDFVLPPAPAYAGAQWLALVQEVYDVSQSLTPERIFSANFWADGPGTATPPGHWNQIAVDLGTLEALNECRMARMLALLNTAQADAFVACWWNKYHHDLVRPITEVRLRHDANWTSLVGTPPFPAYPSGHSSTSGAASQILAWLFPSWSIELTFMGTDAMNSRLYGGIHYAIDNNGGMDLGRSIANLAITRASADGSP